MIPPVFQINMPGRAQGDLSSHFTKTLLAHLFIYFYDVHPTLSPSSLYSVTAGSCLSFI